MKGFKKVFIPSGKKIKVDFILAKEDICFWSAEKKNWEFEKGKVKINIGSSSKDIRLQSLIELN